MADENLRLQAEVVDKFSGPLRRLRDGLRGVRAPEDMRRIQSGFESLKRGAEMASHAVRTTLGVALTGIGITSITAGGALAGLFAAAKNFGTSAAELRFFSQEVGVTARNIRRLEDFGANFNVSADQVRAGVGKVSESMRELRRGHGDLADYLRRINPDLFNQLRGSATNNQALGHLLGYLEMIPDAADRAAFAAKVFGNSAWGRFGQGGPGSIAKEMVGVDRNLGAPTDADMEAADRFLRAWNDISSTMTKVRNIIGGQALPMMNTFLEGFHTRLASIDWEKLVGEGVTKFKELVAEIGKIGKALGEVDWKLFGNVAMGVLTEIGTFVTELAKAIRDIKKLFNGDFSGFRFERLPGAQPSDPGAAAAAGLKERQLSALEREIARRQATGQDTSALEKQRGQIVDELKALREKMRENVREGVKEGMQGLIQQQPFGGGAGGWGAGGLFHNASLGGGAGPGGPFPRMPRLARGGGGGAGEDGPSVAVTPFSGAKTFASKAPEVMRRLMKDFDLTKEQAAGIVGNLGHESGGFRQMQELRPLIPGSRGGFGWAQWTGPRRRAFEAWAAKNGLDPKSDEANYGFLAHELRTTEKGALAAVRRSRTAQEAMTAFELGYERSGIKAWGSRSAWTNRALDAYRQAPPAQDPARASLSRMGDDLMRSRFANPEITGRAGVDIRLQGFPQGTKVNTSTEGIFQDVRLDRGRQLGAMMA